MRKIIYAACASIMFAVVSFSVSAFDMKDTGYEVVQAQSVYDVSVDFDLGVDKHSFAVNLFEGFDFTASAVMPERSYALSADTEAKSYMQIYSTKYKPHIMNLS